jgi:DNA-binding IclR family transcriptional regulator
MSKSNGDGVITALDNGLRLLMEAANRPSFGLSEMARALDLAPSTVDRLITTLARRGLLERSGLEWRMGKAAAALWAGYRRQQEELILQAQRNLSETNIATEETDPCRKLMAV